MEADQNQQRLQHYSTTYGSSSSSTTQEQEQEQAVKYKGVRKRKWGKWVSEIRLPNSRERIWLGSYDSPEKAARAFDAALYCLRGPGARFNFPHNPPDFLLDGSLLTPQDIQLVAARYANPISTTRSTHHIRQQEDGQQLQQAQTTTTTLLFSTRDGIDKGNCSNTTSSDEDVLVGPPVITTTTTTATTTTTNTTHQTPIDWSFLGMLDAQSHHQPPQPPGDVAAAAAAAAAASDHHFELFSGMDNMSMSMDMNMAGGDYYHDTNHMDFDSNVNGDGGVINHNHYHHHDQMAGDEPYYSYHSFLWNF
ncbi:Ethylene-responsive transcription factor ERF016 [Linum grandiflorum]